MDDKMKEFIDAHRDEFDNAIPRESTWQKIGQELPRAQQAPKRFLRIAIAVVIVLGIGGLISIFSEQKTEEIAKNSSKSAIGNESEFPLMNSDLAEVEHYYMTQVAIKQKELINYRVDEELLSEVELLKEEFEGLKKEMGQAADPSKVIEAMIENYQMRLEILKDILQEMKKEEMKIKINKGDGEYI